MIEGIAIGFLIGFLLGEGKSYLSNRDLLDRLSWRNPSDYWFMTQERKRAKAPSRVSLAGLFETLKKKPKEPPTDKIDPKAVAEDLEKQIEANQFQSQQYARFVKQREEAQREGRFI